MSNDSTRKPIEDKPMSKIEDISTLNDALTLTTLTAETLARIDTDKVALRNKQTEIDELTTTLKEDVISNNITASDDIPNYRDRNKKGQSASEKMEKIKAFVELTKASVDISKTMISISERQHKIVIDSYKTYKANAPVGEGTNTLTPAAIAKMVKEAKDLKDKDKKD